MFPWIVAGVFLLVEAGLAAWCWMQFSRRGVGATSPWRVGLITALLTVPVVPGPDVPVRVERVHYSGPDLLAEEDPRSSPAAASWILPGVVRVRTLRIDQAGTLLSEERRVEGRIPWLLLCVAGGWVLSGRCGRTPT